MNHIKELRTQKGMRQIDLAEKIGVLQSTISHWENGKVEPDMESLIKMAELFETTVDRLVGGTGKHTKPSGGIASDKDAIIRISGRHQISADALDVAFAYDDATPEIQSAVRRVLALPDADLGSNKKSEQSEEAM